LAGNTFSLGRIIFDQQVRQSDRGSFSSHRAKIVATCLVRDFNNFTLIILVI
jgi:hypothetical protein